MKLIWICCFSIFSSLCFSQSDDQNQANTVKNQKYGLRIGADITKLGYALFDKNYSGLEIVADYRYNQKIYFATELGYENKTSNTPQLNYNTSGTFLKIGFDYNTYQNWLDMQNQIYIGFRYGTSLYNQTLNNYRIYYNTNGFFDEHQLIVADSKYPNLNAHWIELAGGIKVEILKNIFIGFKIALHYKVAESKLNNFENLYIPNFGRTYQDSNFGVGFNYTVSFLLPFYSKSTPTQ
ncbi:MAG: DUF6048 family protein [Bacteroidota bacterium]|nr:DUF6048 family protein [Bacteroidota bacterium]